MKAMRFDTFAALAAHQRRKVFANDALLLQGVPLDNNVFLSLAQSLGSVSSGEAQATRENREPGGIYLVRPRHVPLNDSFGNPVISTSRQAFPLHTDEFFLRHPSEIVMLLCFTADASGGDTLVADVNKMTGSLTEKQLVALSTKFVRLPFGCISILRETRSCGYRVAYNRYEIDKFSRTLEHKYNSDELKILDEFDAVANACALKLRLVPGDCLILDNRCMLHGRTSVEAQGDRVLKRIRVRLMGLRS